MSTPSVQHAPRLDVAPSGDFVDWLAASGGSLAVTTYTSGKLAVIAAPHGKLSVMAWKFARPMGLDYDGRQLALAVREQLFVFNVVGDAEGASLVPAAAYATGRLDIHDLAFADRGLYFVNTRFNCLSRPSDRVNFLRSWHPRFITQPVPRDCCHLNGLGLRDGIPSLVTAFCEGDSPGAWRGGDRFASGVAIDVKRNRVVARGLNMPHSPRWHNGRWWLCNSGEGALSQLDLATGAVQEVVALPGFTRGLAFAAGRAIVGRSRIRPRHILDAPPVRARFPELRAGISLVDPLSGRETGALDFLSGGTEVFDVAFLPDVTGLTMASANG